MMVHYCKRFYLISISIYGDFLNDLLSKMLYNKIFVDFGISCVSMPRV